MKKQLPLAIMAMMLYPITAFAAASDGIAAEVRPAGDAKKVVLVIADYLSLDDLMKTGETGWLLENSYLGLVSNRQNGKASAYKSKAVIGAGRRIEAASDMLGGGRDKTWLEQYRLNTGLVPKPEQPVYPKINKLKSINRDEGYEALIGYIGDSIHSGNGKTCFLGNADTGVRNRSAILIPMDRNGTVDYGNTEDAVLYDSHYPYFLRTDYQKLGELYKQFLPASSFVVIETGDMERLEKYKANIPEALYDTMKRELTGRIGSFIQNTLLDGGNPPVLILLSTYPSAESYGKGDRLTPILVYDGQKKGVLASAGTKREGILLNTELADYFLFKLGMRQKSSVSELSNPDSLDFISGLNAGTVNVSTSRLPVLTTYAVYVIISLFLSFLSILSPFLLKMGKGVPIRLLLASNLMGPLLLLLLPAAFIPGPLPYIAVYFCVLAILSFLLARNISNVHRMTAVICLPTVLGLTLDILSGSPMIKHSVLGYDPIIGARFYGIGNEFAGVFIGSSIILASTLEEIYHKKIKTGYVILYYLLCACILALPFLGANLGGMLSALTGYYMALILRSGRKLSLRRLFLLPAILAGFISLITVWDLLRPGDSISHVGLFFRDIRQNGIEVLLSTFARKLAMNVKLIRSTIWTKVLLCIIFIMIVIYFKPVGVVKRVFRAQPRLKTGWFSVAAAGVTGLAVNDSGIVLAATAMIYVGFTLLLFCFDT